MILHSLITCLVLGATVIASAQTAADPGQPLLKSGAGTLTLKPGGGVILAPPNTAAQGALRELSVQGGLLVQTGLLEMAVGKLKAAYSKLVPENGFRRNQMPTLVYGPGAREAKIEAPLRLANLTEMRAIDSVALVAAAAGCILDPIYAPRLDGDENNQHIIGYSITLASSRPSSSSSKTGSDIRGGESRRGDALGGSGVVLEKKDGNIVVSRIIPGSAAEQMRVLKPGDRILKVAEDGQADVDVTGLPLEKVEKMIFGKPGSVVALTIGSTPDGETHRVSLGFGKFYADTSSSANALQVTEFEGFVQMPNTALAPNGGGTGAPAMHPLPKPVAPGSQIVRVYSIGFLLDPRNQGDDKPNLTEGEFNELLTEALENAGVAGAAPKIYFHSKSQVLITKGTAEEQEIILQVINVLRMNSGYPPIE